MARTLCPEAMYGQHGEPNTVGKCPYCGSHLYRPGPGRPSLPLEDRRQRADRRYARDAWGRIDVPVDQDPIAYLGDGDE